MTDDDRVLGMALGGMARAHPVRKLNWREAVNDTMAGQALIVTDCPLCGTGMAFEPPKRSGSGGFGVSGLHYTDTGLEHDCTQDPCAACANVPQLMFDVQHRSSRLPLKAQVLVLRAGGAAKAYSCSVLTKVLGKSGQLNDTVGQQRVKIRFSRARGMAEAFDAQGLPLASIKADWFARVAFQPKTDALRPP